MKTSGQKLFWMVVLLLSCFATANAQRMPQDNWYLDKSFGSAGSGDGQFNGVWGLATGNNDNLFVVDLGNHRIQVFDQDGNFLFKWGSYGSGNQQFNSPRAIAIGTNDLVYVADQGNNRIQVFDQQGTFLRGWPCPSPVGVAVNFQNGLIHVADNANKQVKVFADTGTTGTLVRAWGEAGSMPGKFEDMRGITVSIGGGVYVADARSIQAFDVSGAFIKERLQEHVGGWWCICASKDGLILAGHSFGWWNQNYSDLYYLFDQELNLLLQKVDTQLSAATISSSGTIYAAPSAQYIQILRRTVRTPQNTLLPVPGILAVSQRPGTTYVDIDYEVADKDSPAVTVGALAFSGGVNSLNNLLRLNTFVEGTASNVGANVAANQPHRLTWNAAADWTVDYGEAKFRILANDGRAMLDHIFINLPADAANPALTIARDPVTQYDLLHCWYWLIATNAAAINLVSGRVYGVDGAYSGVLLASDTTTTAQGRAFLFERMGVREATLAELSRIRSGAVGVINQWAPRLQVGPGERPKAVNEWGFDTGNWGSDGWWVVKP